MITFLHTSPIHVPTFEALVAELAPGTPTTHIVREELLDQARAEGNSDAVKDGIAAAIAAATVDSGVILCTCSTIGAAAEAMTTATGQPVLRVDRAMAEQAVTLGNHIVVAAALESTIGPTEQLIHCVAATMEKPVQITHCFCEGAWERFEAGDLPGYHRAIAQSLQHYAEIGDLIVLAQASMAPAAALCTEIPVPILSSPRLGVEKALAFLVSPTIA